MSIPRWVGDCWEWFRRSQSIIVIIDIVEEVSPDDPEAPHVEAMKIIGF